MKVSIENALYKLYYLLIASDGKIYDDEKNSFIEIVTKHSKSTKSYGEVLFNVTHKFANCIKYDDLISKINNCDNEIKENAIKVLNELAMADGQIQKEEFEYIKKVKSDLNI